MSVLNFRVSLSIVITAVAGLALWHCAAPADGDGCAPGPVGQSTCPLPRLGGECQGGIGIRVLLESPPVITWDPPCGITHLAVSSVGSVGQPGALMWSFSTVDSALVRPVVRYGELPPGATAEGPTLPLAKGVPYRVNLAAITGGQVRAGGESTFIP